MKWTKAKLQNEVMLPLNALSLRLLTFSRNHPPTPCITVLPNFGQASPSKSSSCFIISLILSAKPLSNSPAKTVPGAVVLLTRGPFQTFLSRPNSGNCSYGSDLDSCHRPFPRSALQQSPSHQTKPLNHLEQFGIKRRSRLKSKTDLLASSDLFNVFKHVPCTMKHTFNCVVMQRQGAGQGMKG